MIQYAVPLILQFFLTLTSQQRGCMYPKCIVSVLVNSKIFTYISKISWVINNF